MAAADGLLVKVILAVECRNLRTVTAIGTAQFVLNWLIII